jgi:hypothetical protein
MALWTGSAALAGAGTALSLCPFSFAVSTTDQPRGGFSEAWAEIIVRGRLQSRKVPRIFREYRGDSMVEVAGWAGRILRGVGRLGI